MIITAESRFYKVKQNVTAIVFCMFALSLTACTTEDISDLDRYIKSVKAKPKGTIQPLPEIKVVEPFIFNPEGLRDPFRAIEKIEAEESLDLSAGSGIRPDTSRRKEELEAYSLDTLAMVGTLTMDERLWALIKANDGTIHRVQKGNHIGRNYGEIIRILDDKIEIMEIVPDRPGTWREKQATLVLAE